MFTTVPVATESIYTITPRTAVTGIGASFIWDFGRSNSAKKGRSFIAFRGAGTIALDIYDINTDRWETCRSFWGQKEALTTGWMYAYDGKDNVYISSPNVLGADIFSLDLNTMEIKGVGRFPGGQSTALIGNRFEIIQIS